MASRTAAREDARGLRVALFTDTYAPQLNGVTRTLERLVHAVESRGGAVRVYTVDDPGAVPDARVVRYPSNAFWAYPQLRIAVPRRRDVLADVAAWEPTLAHVTTPFGVGLAGRHAARTLGIPLVSSYHTSFGEYLRHYGLQALDGIAWPFLRWFHDGGLRTLAPSRAVAAELRAQGFQRVGVWGRGVDPQRFHPRFRSATMRREMGAGPDDLVVAYVGRIAPEKGVRDALSAMREVTARRPDVRFAIAGDGPDEAHCRRIAAPGTWFAGALHGERLAAFYASADAFVFPSTTETFGNVVLEAMASGLPVIAPDVGATLELADARSAALFRGGDATALRDAVLAVLADAPRRAALRDAGLAVAATRSWDAIWDGLLAEYRALSSPARRPLPQAA